MAQTIYCDLEGCQAEDGSPTPAVWLVTNLTSGDRNAWCTPHYLELSRALLAAASPEPEPAPVPGPDQPDADDEDAADAEALRRLETAGRARTADVGAEVAGPTNATNEAPGPAGEAVEGPTVVRRGTSKSRRAHEARKRAKTATAAEPEPAD